MNWVRRIVVGLIVASFVACSGAVLLFNWSALGYKTLAVPTGSMRPSIPPGSLVLVHRVPVTSLKVGDVITYTSPLNMKKTITHRIIKTYKINGIIPSFVTKGDANPSADPPVVAGLVLGKAAWHIPYVGSWMLWSKTWWGIAVLVYTPAMLLMIEEVRRLAEYLKSLQPYQLPGFKPKVEPGSRASAALAMGTTVSMTFVLLAMFLWQPALALLKSNTVALTNNRISVAAVHHQCSGNTTNNTTININNSSNQTASSGNATVSGNTNGGSATSGSAGASNSTNISINVTNCH